MKLFTMLGKKLSIKKKIVLLAILSTLIPLLFVGTFTFLYMNRVIENKISETTSNLLSLINWNIDTFVTDIQGKGTVILGSNDTQAFLTQEGLTKETYQTQVTTRDLLINITGNHDYINSVYVGNEQREYLQLTQGQSSYYDNVYDFISQEDWFTNVLGNNLYGLWLESEKINFYDDSNLLVYARAIKDLQTFDVIGVLMITVDKAIFENMFQDIKQDGEIMVVNQGKILYSNGGNEAIYESVLQNLHDLQTNVSKIISLNDEKYILNYDINEQTNWGIVSLIPYTSIVKEFQFVRMISVLLLVLSFIIATASAFLISNKITSQLSLLRNVLPNLKNREKIQDVQFDPDDEVGKIGAEFITIYNRNLDLTIQLYESQLKEKEAELLALQNHINPHFLYNTLNSIYWMAVKAKVKPIAKMAIHLANIFKLTLNDGGYITTVKRELEQVTSYLDIQNIRYDNRIQYQIHVDEDIYEASIIKLLLQPLVENAVYHGLEMKQGSWEITINGKKEGNSLLFEVKDNGVGFDPLENKKGRKGYAIKNIEERIKLQYGSDYGLSISSKEGEGTRVTLRIGLQIDS